MLADWVPVVPWRFMRARSLYVNVQGWYIVFLNHARLRKSTLHKLDYLSSDYLVPEGRFFSIRKGSKFFKVQFLDCESDHYEEATTGRQPTGDLWLRLMTTAYDYGLWLRLMTTALDAIPDNLWSQTCTGTLWHNLLAASKQTITCIIRIYNIDLP